MTKSWYAASKGIDPQKIFVVSVMPCTAKKYEVTRPELTNDDMANVDAVLTTRELARMIREAGIDFTNLPDEPFDSPMGQSTGAADIFGTTGGGQPRPTNDAIREKRLEAIYREDEGKPLRKSHENPDIKQLYSLFLGSPCGHLSHELLHTTYTRRNRI